LFFATGNSFPKFNFRHAPFASPPDAFQHHLLNQKVGWKQMKKALVALACICTLVGGAYFAASKWAIRHETLNL